MEGESGMTIDLTLLGTGTSGGIPFVNCDCPTCTSTDPRDKRYRTCGILKISNGKNVLIDCGTDIRKCLLREGITHIEGIIISHCHADHVHGLPDLVKFYNGHPIPIYCNDVCGKQLKGKYSTLVEGDDRKFDVNITTSPFKLCDVTFTPVPIMHGKLPIFGYRFGNATYITDCKTIPNDSYKIIDGSEILVINTLANTDHETHLSYEQSLAEIRKIKPKVAYLVHMTHTHNHEFIQNYFDTNKQEFPETKNIEIIEAVDGIHTKPIHV
ncbi:metallo-beta-lactamase superfamily protein [Trichomonas vaginalis G3]|uniref:Metallo-beta-lactamase superfamily protein n=1 Tax=Trichomonas vaginalis (strain ATCC PRA-98 / G3) TaxID=412133 RepID=A2EZM9_TRIV3|nr:beta-lactamase superfamily domain-containing protein [Trichomonas vaginalis G3]EAY01867.1 metallo-beta-lactamase superfamily protein [Trichomonas vaginalis G3]KAI5549666.1 beta-lactamase superfamily domain-containing protein [Trichomonas vaginalis G3]|eukprot:XP_001314411.1 metallo-beta-lactamase superfamily protein [Trichomonas vaginalis G3]